MILLFLICMEVVLCQKTVEQWSGPTPGVFERVEILKHELNRQIKEKQKSQLRMSALKDTNDQNQKHQLLAPINNEGVLNDDYEYVDVDKIPVTPIMDFDDRKKKNKFRLRKLKPKAGGFNLPTKAAVNDQNRTNVYRIEPKRTESGNPEAIDKVNGTVKGLDALRMKKFKPENMMDIFYRRFTDHKARNTPSAWTHCQCLISPFLNGYKTDISELRRVTVNENVVSRLVQLLKEDASTYTKEEVYSIMYQISNMQLRFFDWDVTAVSVLLNALCDDRKHTFRNIKSGLRKIFVGWRLDIGNTTNLLKQTRIYRPPCVSVSDYTGSTKTSRVARYYTKATTKDCRANENDDYDC